MSAITRDEVAHLARLSRLALTDDELDHYAAQLDDIIAASGRRLSKRGRPMLRRLLYLLAGRWCQARGLYRADYLRLRAAGRSGTEACVILARRLVPILFAVLRDRKPFAVEHFHRHRHAIPATS